MVFSNDKISPKQLYRLIVVSTLGITCILHTDLCVKYAGGYGLLCLLMEMVFTGLYTWFILFLCRKCEWNFVNFKHKFLPDKLKKLVYTVFILKYLTLLILATSFLCKVVKRELLAEMGYMGILIPILLLMAYSVSKGVEARARLSETTIYFVLVFILLLAFLGLNNLKMEYVVISGIGEISGIFVGGIKLFLLFSPVEILLFMSDCLLIKVNGAVNKQREKKYEKAIIGGIVTTFIINVIYYIVCTGTLSTQVIMAKGDSVISLAKNVKLPYMIFEKHEGIFMSCFVISIFFTIFCLGHHTINMGERLFGKINRTSYVALILFTFMGCFMVINYTDMFVEIKVEKEKRVEIENRDYADSIYIDYMNGEYDIALVFPNETSVEDIMEFEVKNPKDIISEYENKSDKKLDLSHVQVVFINERILEDSTKFYRIFYFLESDDNYSDNMTICATSQTIGDFVENTESISPAPGKFISRMLENNLNINKTRYKDLRILMYDAGKYCVLSRFNALEDRMEYQGEVKVDKEGIVR